MNDCTTTIRRVAVFFSLCFVCVAGALAYRMIVAGDETARRPFYDQSFIDLMERLIAEQVLYEQDGAVQHSPDKLREQVPGPGLRRRVLRTLDFVYADRGSLVFDRNAVKVVNRRLDLDADRIIRGRFLDRNGVVLAESAVDPRTGRTSRHYPGGPLYFHTIGYSNRVYGSRYLERSLNDYLMGTTHKSVLRRAYDFLRMYRVGDDVVLTLDSRIQQAAYDALGDRRGAVVVVRPRTGEVLACVSRPAFDPNTAPGLLWNRADRDREQKPFVNRAVAETYPPGSIFKIITAAAWLEWEQMDPVYQLTCTGYSGAYRIRDRVKHGAVRLTRAFAQSCNIFFTHIGVKMGARLLDYSGMFGFNRVADLIPQDPELSFPVEPSLAFAWHEYEDVKDHASGAIVRRRDRRTYAPRDFIYNPRIVAQCAIGQNLIAATPLHMAMVAAAVANGGELLQPHIVKSIHIGSAAGDTDAPGWGYATFDTHKAGRAIDTKTAARLTDLMVEVMQTGTGKQLKKIFRTEDGPCIASATTVTGSLVPVAAKTGTAEVVTARSSGAREPAEKPHAWFVCFAPADKPQVAVAVLVENAGWGSTVAGPIAIDVLTAALNAAVQ